MGGLYGAAAVLLLASACENDDDAAPAAATTSTAEPVVETTACDDAVPDDRDVIVFDQRGIGASTPSLDCPEYTDAVWQMLGVAAPPIDELAISDAAFRACRDRLVDEGVAPGRCSGNRS